MTNVKIKNKCINVKSDMFVCDYCLIVNLSLRNSEIKFFSIQTFTTVTVVQCSAVSYSRYDNFKTE